MYRYDDMMRGPRREMDMRMRDYDYEEDYRPRKRDYSSYDYAKESASYDDMKHWSKRLIEEMEDKYKQFFKMENITAKAEEMGIRFDKFDPFELYVTVLMMFSDFKDALNTANADVYIKLAKAWLCDDDVSVRYGDKLHAYYKHIVDGRF